MKPVNVINGINVAAHGGLVASVAHRYRRFVGGILEWEDLMQAGWFGVHRAAERFDHSRGLKFSTYASNWIRAFIRRTIMNERRTVRIPVHRQESAYQRGELMRLDALSLDAPINANESGGDTWLDFLRSDSDPGVDAEQSDLEAMVDAAVEGIGEKERRVIRGRFWRDHTLGEIGDDMGVSRERVRQRQEKALARLGQRLSKESL